jgi:hypothetical protein
MHFPDLAEASLSNKIAAEPFKVENHLEEKKKVCPDERDIFFA